jgi:hypothetical protein
MSAAPPPPGIDAALARWAAQVLAGTGLTPEAAAAAAADPGADVPPAAARAVRALRDGWDAAEGSNRP